MWRSHKAFIAPILSHAFRICGPLRPISLTTIPLRIAHDITIRRGGTMTNRNLKLATVALSAVLGGLTPSLAQQAVPAAEQTTPAQQTNAAEACQPAPKGAAPQGKHWYYHTDRSVGRKCWYLGEAGMKTTTSSAAAKPKSDTAPTARQNIDNARAEAPASQASKPSVAKPAPPAEPEATSNTAPQTTEAVTAQPTPNPAASTPLLTERWPDADAFRPASQQTTGQSTPLASSQPATSEAAPPAPAMKPAATPPAPRAKSSEQAADLTPWRVIFGVAFLVLALIAILALVTFRYFWRTGDKVRNAPAQFRNIWGEAEDTEASSPAYTEMIAPSRWASAARTSRAPQDLDEIEQLLRRAARESENVISLTDPAIRARTPTAPSAARASTAQRAGSFRPR